MWFLVTTLILLIIVVLLLPNKVGGLYSSNIAATDGVNLYFRVLDYPLYTYILCMKTVTRYLLTCPQWRIWHACIVFWHLDHPHSAFCFRWFWGLWLSYSGVQDGVQHDKEAWKEEILLGSGSCRQWSGTGRFGNGEGHYRPSCCQKSRPLTEVNSGLVLD